MPRSENKVGRKLKRYRLNRRWRYQQMADLLDMSVGNYWKIENQAVRPSELTVEKIRAALPGIIGGI